MIPFNPWNVILLLYATFTARNLLQTPVTSEEMKMKEKIVNMLTDMENNMNILIKEEKTLDFYDTNEIPQAERVDLLEHDEDEDYLPEEVICTDVEVEISSDYKRKAVELWKSGKIRPRTIEGIRRRYKKVTSIRQLRRWEDYINAGGSRNEKLKAISSK
ncbi:uncharacterized protein LOC112588193 [Harpegnathos saltator]|uniref:uncharacterized protein LOC112588193 n=1 Tax=Harpegnathos saltator TaxID=610380 RepID=UPI000DBECEEC|nr:uncharacterized protein LOC112588193 [Harpegnathos saltator]